MNKAKILFGIIVFFVLGISSQLYAQCNFYAEKCAPKLEQYKSDGQFHGALLTEGETVEFVATFYAGTTYRVLTCTGPHSDTLVYRILDSNYNLLFSNTEFNYSQWYDIKFNATDKYYIQAELKEGAGSGCAVVLIGFKQ